MARLINRIHVAAEILKSGDLVALPTETVYGLAGRIDREASLEKIFEVKERPLFDPLIVHIAGHDQAQDLVCGWNDLAASLAAEFWPGPLTIILKKSDQVSPLITASHETVALRCPDHPMFQSVLDLVAVPLAMPSANRFGRTSPTKASHVLDEFPHQDISVLEGGDCRVGIESTVIRVDSNERLSILRPGAITQKTLTELFPEIQVVEMSSDESPGHLKDHYQPDRPLFLVPEEWTDADVYQATSQKAVEISLSTDPLIAAREIYHDLRTTEGPALFIKRTQERSGDAWTAIWDRLEKAAIKTFTA